MKDKFCGICILLSAIIISASLIYAVMRYENFTKESIDRYDFYVYDNNYSTVMYTFDKFTGEYSRRVMGSEQVKKWNDIN